MGDLVPATPLVPAITPFFASGLFRSIVERSPMQNNDEWVCYAARAMSREDAEPYRLVISRPVYAVEVDAGLSIEDGSLFDRWEPEITLVIDAVWRIRGWFAASREVGRDFDVAMANYIAHGYYDCMSGGMPKYVVAILRWACEEFGVPDDIEVYPGSDQWSTISDFLAETAGAPDIRAIDGGRGIPRRLLCDGSL